MRWKAVYEVLFIKQAVASNGAKPNEALRTHKVSHYLYILPNIRKALSGKVISSEIQLFTFWQLYDVCGLWVDERCQFMPGIVPRTNSFIEAIVVNGN